DRSSLSPDPGFRTAKSHEVVHVAAYDVVFVGISRTRPCAWAASQPRVPPAEVSVCTGLGMVHMRRERSSMRASDRLPVQQMVGEFVMSDSSGGFMSDEKSGPVEGI